MNKTTIVAYPDGLVEVRNDTNRGHNVPLEKISSARSLSITEITPDDVGRSIIGIKTMYWDGHVKRVTTVGNTNRVNLSVIGEGRLIDRLESKIIDMSSDQKSLIIDLWNNVLLRATSKKVKSRDVDSSVLRIIVNLICCCTGYLYYVTRPSNEVGSPFHHIDLNLDFNSETVTICQELFTLVGSLWSEILQLHIETSRGFVPVAGMTWLKMFTVCCRSMKELLVVDSEIDWIVSKTKICNIITGWGNSIIEHVNRCVEPYRILAESDNESDESVNGKETEDDTQMSPTIPTTTIPTTTIPSKTIPDHINEDYDSD